MLDELSVATPERLWIDAFDNVAGVVNLSGLGFNEEVVATFLQKLESSPYYMTVELQSLEQATIDGNKLHKFKIVAREEAPVKKVDTETAKKSDPAKKS
jgi:type IV pilus assembly protein PilN